MAILDLVKNWVTRPKEKLPVVSYINRSRPQISVHLIKYQGAWAIAKNYPRCDEKRVTATYNIMKKEQQYTQFAFIDMQVKSDGIALITPFQSNSMKRTDFDEMLSLVVETPLTHNDTDQATALNHGDFTWWNVWKNDKGELVVIDWDDHFHGLPYYDILTYFISCAYPGNISISELQEFERKLTEATEHYGTKRPAFEDLYNLLKDHRRDFWECLPTNQS